jgi:hypothetical protein
LHFTISRDASPVWRLFVFALRSPLFELALVLVRFDHVASRIINVDHGIVHILGEALGQNRAASFQPATCDF